MSWRQHFEQLPVEQLCALLQVEADVAPAGETRVVWPLELLALRQVLRTLCISRTPKTHQDVGKSVPLHAINSLLCIAHTDCITCLSAPGPSQAEAHVHEVCQAEEVT